MKAGPTVSGSECPPSLNEDHMDEQMTQTPKENEDLVPYFHEEYRNEYPNLKGHFDILEKSFVDVKDAYTKQTKEIHPKRDFDNQAHVIKRIPSNWPVL